MVNEWLEQISKGLRDDKLKVLWCNPVYLLVFGGGGGGDSIPQKL